MSQHHRGCTLLTLEAQCQIFCKSFFQWSILSIVGSTHAHCWHKGVLYPNIIRVKYVQPWMHYSINKSSFFHPLHVWFLFSFILSFPQEYICWVFVWWEEVNLVENIFYHWTHYWSNKMVSSPSKDKLSK